MRQETGRLEKFRAWGAGCGMNGAFSFPSHAGGGMTQINVIASDGDGWDTQSLGEVVFEHVSVSVIDYPYRTPMRTPRWDEMCYVKNLFWEPEELVLQLHPPRSEYVNIHKFVLHLWKPIGVSIHLPPKECV